MFITLKMSFIRIKKTMNKLWQTNNNKLHPLVEKFTVQDDYLLDLQLLSYDVKASLAHAKMLYQMDVLNKKELLEIQLKLKKISFAVIEKNQEDGHTAIENYLGKVGKKIHTGRSRNDQSLVMIRLFMKDKLKQINQQTKKLIKVIKKKKSNIPMPGYTHLQKAMPTTVGVWLDSFSQALKDFQFLLVSTMKLIDQNPLGSASGFGISNFVVDKEYTTKILGFQKTQSNPMYCGFSRGYFENIVLQTLSQPMIIASRFANDMLLFTTQEFNFFSLPDSFTTGSSIMPQKRNYDVLEIMRANIKVFTSYQSSIQSIVSSIGSGYQRDLQLTKKPFVEGVNLCLDTIILLTAIVEALQVNKERLKTAMTDDLYLTNQVYELVNQGLSFRDAYIKVKKDIY
jgi:argininosuccinate lyase